MEMIDSIPLLGKIAGMVGMFGFLGTGLALFMKIRKLVKEAKDVIEHVKILYIETKKDPKFKKLLKELDELMDVVADICKQIPVRAIKDQERYIRELIKKEDYK